MRQSKQGRLLGQAARARYLARKDAPLDVSADRLFQLVGQLHVENLLLKERLAAAEDQANTLRAALTLAEARPAAKCPDCGYAPGERGQFVASPSVVACDCTEPSSCDILRGD